MSAITMFDTIPVKKVRVGDSVVLAGGRLALVVAKSTTEGATHLMYDDGGRERFVTASGTVIRFGARR